MLIKRQLTEVSLAEIFHVLSQKSQTGLLTIDTHTPNNSPRLQKYYIGLNQGCIVAVNNHLNGHGLLSKIEQRKWLSNENFKLLVDCYSGKMPLGMFLKAEKALNAQQLKLLFYAQVVQPVCGLFKLKDGQLEFDSQVTLPLVEMTGLSLSAARATLFGLRVLRDWDSLSAKLPNSRSTLHRVILDKPNFQLDLFERQVWELATGERSLEVIAEELSLITAKVQQIAFRLIMAGLAEEVSQIVPAF